jgi:hypothetical protein
MALPDDSPSSAPVLADYLAPYSWYRGPLEDWEEGGVALNDGSTGLQVQMWFLSYVADEQAANYGDFVVTGQDTGESAAIINVPGVTRVGLAFNQNNDPFLCYETNQCAAKFYWYDATIEDYTTTTLPAGSHSLACCLDDHRQTQTATSDIILAYIRGGTLYYRQERDRFDTERSLGSVGGGILHRVGMSHNLRLKFDVREGPGQRLSEIVGDLCRMAGLPANRFDVEALYPIIVRGYKSSQMYAAGDAIRSLMQLYFFDFPRIDGKLVAVRRGGEVVATISQADLVAGREFKFESGREQGVEFPTKLHLGYAPAETEYTPTKETAERRSPDWKARSEDMIEAAVNLEAQEAAERIDILQKIADAEFAGWGKFSIPESFAELVPSCLVNFEVEPDTYKRLRLVRMVRVDGAYDCEAVVDRQSSYTAGTIGLPDWPAPETPPPTIPGDTTWEMMDAPVLDGVTDTLHYYVAGRGDVGTAWHGYRVQREVGADWETEVDVGHAELMGALEAALPYSSGDFIDTTNALLVSLSGTPASITTDLLLQGRGAWLLISASTFEIVQVRDWTVDGANWRGEFLSRGRLDTVAAEHPIGTRAVFLANPVRVPVDGALLDTSLQLRAASFGQAGSDAADAAYPFIGRSQEEWPPVLLEAARHSPAPNDWSLSWTPRWRLGSSAAPVPSANFYAWRLRFTVGATTVVHDTAGTDPAYTYSEAEQEIDFGSAQAAFDAVEVRALNYLGGEGKALSEAIS